MSHPPPHRSWTGTQRKRPSLLIGPAGALAISLLTSVLAAQEVRPSFKDGHRRHGTRSEESRCGQSRIGLLVRERGGCALPSARQVLRARNHHRWEGRKRPLSSWEVRTGAGATNTLRLTLKGAEASAYANDRPAFSFRGDLPHGGSDIGLFGRSEPAVANIWTFANLRITD